ncbi:tetratricopeptide repeat-containing sensor histidine kinase [Flavobacterium silvaticum]|uniref:Tetratricopeptide repeat protein n=1 Tax=Flavobacterium silvaticum TaxID=1852020 RepID=A0A972JEG6_9FLAO|nr:tetratricopeptide repeat protein [Flavobacterium silvaticum]NMH26864.1 tetratricopeptide repeat protein [Flavobacterium silvaticum]
MEKTFAPLPLLVAFLLMTALSFGQKSVIDSLQNELNNHPQANIAKVDLMNSIATKTFMADADKALRLLKESELLAGELNYAKGKAYSQLFSGNALVNKADYTSALSYFQNSFAMYQKLGDKEGLANCRFNFGRCHFYLGDYDKATENYKAAIELCEVTGDQKRLSSSLIGLGVIYAKQLKSEDAIRVYDRALVIDEKLGNKRGVSNGLNNLANLHQNRGEYTLALDYYLRSLEIKKQLSDLAGIAVNQQNIGNTYNALGKPDEALQLYLEALETFEKLKDTQGTLSALTNAGVIMIDKKQSAKAMAFFQRALKMSREIEDSHSIAFCQLNIGSLKLNEKKYAEARNYLEQSVTISKKLGAKKELCFAYLHIGRTYFAEKEYDKALDFATKSAAIANELKLIDQQRDIALLKSEINYATEHYKLAYEEIKTHKNLRDSILSPANLDKAAQLKYKYQFKDSLDMAKNSATTLKKSLTKAGDELSSSNQQKTWWIVGSASLLGLLGLSFIVFRKRRKKLEDKQQSTEQKLLRSQMNPHFIFNSIDNVQSLIFNNKEEDAIEYLNKFSKLTRQILESSDENYISLEEEIEIVENYLSAQQMLHGNKFNYTVVVDESIEPEVTFLPPMLTQPFIENAIKHGLKNKPSDGIITVRFYLEDSHLFFEVSDNGTGFETEKEPSARKSMAMSITKKRLEKYSKDKGFIIRTDNLKDTEHKIIGAQVRFEIPFLLDA